MFTVIPNAKKLRRRHHCTISTRSSAQARRSATTARSCKDQAVILNWLAKAVAGIYRVPTSRGSPRGEKRPLRRQNRQERQQFVTQCSGLHPVPLIITSTFDGEVGKNIF